MYRAIVLAFAVAVITLCDFAVVAEGSTARWEAASDALPNQSCPTWRLNNNAPTMPALGNGVLTISTSSPTSNQYYLLPEPDYVAPSHVVMEFRCRFVSGTSTHISRTSISIQIVTGPHTGTNFFVGNDEAFLLSANLVRGQTASVDTNNSAHVYRVEVDSGAVSVFYDNGGTPILTGSTFTDTGTFPASIRVLWGEGSSGASGISEWEYVEINGVSVPCDVQPGPSSICEDFNSGTLTRSQIWRFQDNPCGAPTIAGGELVLAATSGCASGPALIQDSEVSVIHGDFDVTVDLRLVSFATPPASADIVAGLTVVGLTGENRAVIEWYTRQTAGSCNPAALNVKSWFTTSVNCSPLVFWANVSTPAFRISRTGSTFRTYYRLYDAWVELGVAVLPDEDVYAAVYAGNPNGTSAYDARFDNLCISAATVTAVRPSGPSLFRISSITPNPFNPSTTVNFVLPERMSLTATIWSVTGARVRTLVKNKSFTAGSGSLTWDGRNEQGQHVASGVYFVRLESRMGTRVARAVLLK